MSSDDRDSMTKGQPAKTPSKGKGKDKGSSKGNNGATSAIGDDKTKSASSTAEAAELAADQHVADQAADNDESERRVHARVPIHTAIGWSTESNLYSGLTGNISEGGVFVETHQALPIGTEVTLSVSFEDVDGPRIEVTGKVRWVRAASPSSDTEPGMGIEFDTLDKEHRTWLDEFIAKREPLFHEDDDATAAASTHDGLAAVGASGGHATSDASGLIAIGRERPVWVWIAIAGGVVVLLGALLWTLFSSGEASHPTAVTSSTAGARQKPQPEAAKETPSTQAQEQAQAQEQTQPQAATVADASPAPSAAPAVAASAAVADAAPAPLDAGATVQATTPAAPPAASTKAPAPTPAAPSAATATTNTASTASPGIAAGEQVAAVVRSCVDIGDGISLRIAVYAQADGKVVRGFVGGRTQLAHSPISCVRDKLRGLQLPLTMKQADHIEWALRLDATHAAVKVIRPASLRDR